MSELGWRIRRSSSAVRWQMASMSVKACSAVGSMTGPGVLVTGMPRSRAAAISTLLKPTPKLVINLRLGAAAIISAVIL